MQRAIGALPRSADRGNYELSSVIRADIGDLLLCAGQSGGEALIIDPVLEKVDRYLRLMEELEVNLVKAVDTHLHADHITGLGALRDRTQCITVMGEQRRIGETVHPPRQALHPVGRICFLLVRAYGTCPFPTADRPKTAMCGPICAANAGHWVDLTRLSASDVAGNRPTPRFMQARPLWRLLHL